MGGHGKDKRLDGLQAGSVSDRDGDGGRPNLVGSRTDREGAVRAAAPA